MTNNLKKVISSAAVVAMVASSASAFAVTFPDVDATADYAGAVQTLSALNIVQGDDNGLFNPDNNVTRGEFTKMVVEALGEGSVAEATTTSQFTDAATTTQHWAAGYIATGVSEGWINGYGDGTFGPDDSVTYVQAVKMLVSAIGYESYAQNQGGWPSGYLQFGNSLHIIDGVSATSNDAELTRAQCAMLVANALEAPVVEYGDMTYGGILGNIPVQNLQQMNGTGEGWQTLLTRKHDAYVVRGRVEATSRTNTGLDSDQVKFRVETAENFDGVYYGSNGSKPTSVDVYINDTDAANMLFEYAEAIIQKDDDTDEYKFISITQYGASRTEELDADLYESLTVSENGSKSLNMYRTASSSSTTAYRLEDDAELYVNGVSLGVITADLAATYLDTDNAVGNITLVDETESGSTATNGYYDYITVDYYVDAVVDSVSASDSQVRVYFKVNDDKVTRSRLEWDPQDEDVTVSFTKDDAAITYEDLAEYDVVSIAYDVSSGFAGSTFYDVIVAQNTVTGSISSKNTDDNLIVIDGSDYEMSAITSLADFEFNTEYTIYVDAFGKVAYFEEGAASKTIGVVVAMYKSAGTTNPTVRLITADGTEATYEVRNDEDVNAFAQVATKGAYDADDKTTTYTQEITKNDIVNGNESKGVVEGIQNRVVTYRISSGKIVFTGLEEARGGVGQDYRASSVKLGSYTLDETATSILDMSSYINDDDSVASVTTTASLVDEAEYTAYFYDRSNNSTAYRFVIITEGTNSITPDTHVAVVSGAVSQVSNDNGDYTSIPVVVANSEDVQNVLYEGTETFNEGDVIIYATKSDGTISTLYNVISMANGNTDYATLRGNVLKNDSFTSLVDSAVVDATTNVWFKSTNQKPAEAYFGPIYRKTNNSLELMLKQEEVTVDNVAYKATDLNDRESITDFSVAGDSVASYVVDYSQRTGKAQRVYKGQLNTSTISMYGAANATNPANSDVAYDYILWSGADGSALDNTVIGEDIRPNFAFVKVVDGDVTDVVYFVAD